MCEVCLMLNVCYADETHDLRYWLIGFTNALNQLFGYVVF